MYRRGEYACVYVSICVCIVFCKKIRNIKKIKEKIGEKEREKRGSARWGKGEKDRRYIREKT